ncbi:hypothetical protein [Delftia deserti]|uniref:Uncharacterized protein n=1 Tax=Delftia deserti TaxID=1651218 RepID=A0ABW5EXG1_9BURK
MTTTTPQHDERTTREIIWDNIQEMAHLGQNITRQRLMELTGKSYHIIDDHVSRMISEDGILRRTTDGVYELVKGPGAPRPVSITDLEDGMTLIEIGDQELRLWPRELRNIAIRLQGNAMQHSNLQLQHDVGLLAQEIQLQQAAQRREMSARIKELEGKLKALEGRGVVPSPQMDLLAGAMVQ